MKEFLEQYIKSILLLLAEEFETSLSKTDKSKYIIQAIVEASDYDEVFDKTCVEDIFKEKAEQKQQKKKEEKLRQFLLDKLDKQQQLEEKLRIQNSGDTVSVSFQIFIGIRT